MFKIIAFAWLVWIVIFLAISLYIYFRRVAIVPVAKEFLEAESRGIISVPPHKDLSKFTIDQLIQELQND